VVFIVITEDFHHALIDKEHLLDFAFETDHRFAWLINTAVEIYYQFIDESSFTLFKEMTEVAFKFTEL
jgi:hypothetical protein